MHTQPRGSSNACVGMSGEMAPATPPKSFLYNVFPQAAQSEEQREVHRLRLENSSLKARLLTSQSAFRASEDTLKKLLANIDIITARASANVSKSAPAAAAVSSSHASEHAVYALAASLRTDSPCLDVLTGRQIITHVVAMMTAHLYVMLEHAEYTFGAKHRREYLLRVILANLICWVFGVEIPADGWDLFIAPKQGMTLKEEIPHTIKACMAVRSFQSTHNKFPIELMVAFILNWNSFAVEQIGVHPLPLDPKLGLSASLKPFAFQPAIPCEVATYRKKDGKGIEHLTLRMYPINSHKMPTRLLRNSPGTYALAAKRSMSAPAPPALPMPAVAASPASPPPASPAPPASLPAVDQQQAPKQ
jgi:hypothetical protein